ncbi:hypothetical protein LA080_009867 [Diaporthe eres]|nr:hypothetical protein LA080_009867 [Diaporthe eres]
MTDTVFVAKYQQVRPSFDNLGNYEYVLRPGLVCLSFKLRRRVLPRRWNMRSGRVYSVYNQYLAGKHHYDFVISHEPAASFSCGSGLVGGQIGGISAGAVVGFLLLVAFGWLIVRHLNRISRFMDKFDNSRKSTTIEEDGNTRGVEVTRLDTGNVGAGQPLTELSPQERPQLLDEWGRHGSRGPELTGSYEAHGISELDDASVART